MDITLKNQYHNIIPTCHNKFRSSKEVQAAVNRTDMNSYAYQQDRIILAPKLIRLYSKVTNRVNIPLVILSVASTYPFSSSSISAPKSKVREHN